MKKWLLTLCGISTLAVAASRPATAQTEQSHLYTVQKSGVLRVCEWPMYYAITYRDPTTGNLQGIDADLSKDLAAAMGVKLQYVDTSFSTFVADVQTNKCDIAMFGVGATLKRAEAVAFSHPYLISNVYAVVLKSGKIKNWADIDKPGVTVAVTLGSYTQPLMQKYLKQAKLDPVAPPSTVLAELMSHRADVIMTDYPTSIKMEKLFPTTTFMTPPEKLAVTPYAYVVVQGDQIWLNYINLFVDTIKRDGTLQAAANANGLGPIVAP